MRTTVLSLLCLGLLLQAPDRGVFAQHHDHQHGKVDFDISCNEAAQDRFTTGFALMHHMMYDQAEMEFVAASEVDPDCAMAHWGIAMAQIHPLWGERPSDENQQKAQKALAHAKTLTPASERETAFITAAELFFHNWENTDYPSQLVALEKGLLSVHEAYPDDTDAAALWALLHLATAPKEDKEFTHQKTAGALLEELYARVTDHPGLFHYIIHAYDNPMLAERAIDVARKYDQLAPDVPHALHMPSHIFIRLGLWSDAINWNIRSAASALRQPIDNMTSSHHAHALDYLAYAYLQQAQDEKALEVLGQLKAVNNYQPTLSSAYAQAATPARYYLERGMWAEAAALPLMNRESFPWDRFPGAESITFFARGIGAARSGDAAAAREAIASMDELHERMIQMKEPYWAVLTDAQRQTVAAWIAYSEGDTDRALDMMRGAADLEDSLDKHPVTPGAVLPARELLGEMLVLAEKPGEAIEAYEMALAVSPNRFNSLYGAGRAAELAGDRLKANQFYSKLVEHAIGDSERQALIQARAFIAGN